MSIEADQSFEVPSQPSSEPYPESGGADISGSQSSLRDEAVELARSREERSSEKAPEEGDFRSPDGSRYDGRAKLTGDKGLHTAADAITKMREGKVHSVEHEQRQRDAAFADYVRAG